MSNLMPPYEFDHITRHNARAWSEVAAFLQKNGLDVEQSVQVFLVLRDEDDQIIACGGIAQGIIACVAIDGNYRGGGISLSLASQLILLAAEMGYRELFIFTKPENEMLFSGCGFYPLAQVEGKVVLMENSATRLKQYSEGLAAQRHEGGKIGAIVMNANPFTLGHRYLVEQAAAQCDWLHLFVVSEDASFFSSADRFALVQQGVADIPNITLHEGGRYIISRATFPSYFLKDSAVIDRCHMQIDLTLFRKYIAPPLGITHRFAGSEPFCAVTAAYNASMREWLGSLKIDAPAIQFVEIPRREIGGEAVSASRVRDLLQKGDYAAIRPLVPPTTWNFLQNRYFTSQEAL